MKYVPVLEFDVCEIGGVKCLLPYKEDLSLCYGSGMLHM